MRSSQNSLVVTTTGTVMKNIKEIGMYENNNTRPDN
jgi:hypothetical protein